MRYLALILCVPLTLSAQTATAGRGGSQPAGRGAAAAPPPTPAADLATLEGQVFAAVGGTPLRKANVNLNRQSSSPLAPGTRASYSAVTDSSGRFSITGIEPGTYRLSASHTGYLDTSYNARRPGGSGTPVDFGRAQRLTNVSLKLTPNSLISGKISDEDGDPVEGAQVSALRVIYNNGRKQLQQTESQSSNDVGEFRLSKLVPGQYFVSAIYRSRRVIANGEAAAAPPEDFIATYYPGVADVVAAAAVEVAPGSQVQGLNIRLAKAHTIRIRGRAVNNTTAPPPAPAPAASPATRVATQEELEAQMTALGAVMADLGAQMGGSGMQVRLTPRNSLDPNGINLNVSVKADGTFEFPSVPAGSYYLVGISYRGNRTRAVKQPIEVAGSNIEGITLAINPGPSIAGHVRLEGDTPPDPPKLSVRLSPREATPGIGSVQPAAVGPDGNFRFDDVNPDLYNVSIGTPQGYYIKSIRAGNTDVLVAGLDVTGGAASLDIVLGNNPPQVNGSVVNSDAAQPAPAVTVVLIPQEKDRQGKGFFYFSTTTDQYGSFTLNRVSPGEYRVYAWEDVQPGQWYDPDFMKAFDTKGESVSAREGSPVNLKLVMIAAK